MASLPFNLNQSVLQLEQEFNRISIARMTELQLLAKHIHSQNGEPINLIFICTHNSRRSHIAQLWAQTAATYYNVKNVTCYSGGTEATAFNPNAVEAMRIAGFEIVKVTEDDNPAYAVSFSKAYPPIKVFSKTFDDPFNPQKDFGAIMTCSHADENCPFVPGATFRLSIPYDDPKAFDGTDREAQAYLNSVNEIGREMLYAFSLISIG